MADAMDLFKPETEDQQSIQDQLAAARADLEDEIPDFDFEPTINAEVAAAVVGGLNIPKPETTTQLTADQLAEAMADDLALGSVEEEAALRAAMASTFASDSGSGDEKVIFRSDEMESWPDPKELTPEQKALERMRWREMGALRDIEREWRMGVGADRGVDDPFAGAERVQPGQRSRSVSPKSKGEVKKEEEKDEKEKKEKRDPNDDLGETY
jgi:hypothetical protein